MRVVRRKGSTMWNFTGQAVLIPQLDGIEELFSDNSGSLAPQGIVTDMKADDIFTENDDEKLKIFEASVDRYLLSL